MGIVQTNIQNFRI